ncbi:MAG: ATP-binding cassette domain-containing protein [Segniliparus sp.]|uniref:ATP-binding cassette domain-containing protein n=1 Tax=Segniliparus sp. TaxID=2804064 RepID=UPI003F2C9E4F
MRRVAAVLPAAALVFVALCGPLFAPHRADEAVTGPFAPPGPGSPLGGDELGRDVLSRLLDGGLGLTVTAAVIAVLVTALAAVLGALSALEGPLARGIEACTDLLVLLPPLLVAMLVLLRLGGGSGWSAAGALLLVAVVAGTPYSARVFGGAAAVVAKNGFVEVALSNGSGHWRVAVEEILPNLRATFVTQLALRFVEATALVSTVAFLRLPAALGPSNWAVMVRDSVGPGLWLNPWSAAAPALAIVALSLAVRRAIMAYAPAPAETAHTPPPQSAIEPKPGRMTAVLGASGAGKTTALLRLTSPPGLDGEELRSFRRTKISFVGQDPGSELTPTMRVAALLAETASRPERIPELLARLGIDESCLRKKPRELSGGEQRRVALARALLRENPVLVVDEPFAGLDSARRDVVAALLREAADEGKAVVASGHDEAMLRAMADEVVVVGEAAPRLEGRTDRPLGERAPQLSEPPGVVFEARGLRISCPNGRMLLEDGDFELAAGTLTGLVGDSGTGKTTLARVMVGLQQPQSGEWTKLRPRAIQLVPQNPAGTLNPRRTVRQALLAATRENGRRATGGPGADVAGLLGQVGLSPELADRLPGQLSGGQRQRVAVARALAHRPAVLVCDEVTSALDARTAAGVMRLIGDLAAEEGLSALVVSHDLDLVEQHCHRVLALRDGKLVSE